MQDNYFNADGSNCCIIIVEGRLVEALRQESINASGPLRFLE
jgi:hypothetical protein